MGFQGFLKQSTAVDVLIGPFVDDTDGNTAETALTISAADVRLSKNGQNIVSKNDATACAHDEIGLYNCELDATDTNTVGQLTLTVHETGALHVRHDFHVVEEAIYDALYGASAAGFDANQRVDVGAWLGTAATSGTGGPDVNVNAISDDLTAATNAEAFFDGTGYAGTGNTIPTVTTLTGHTAQTGDSFARIGATGSGLTTLSTQASVNTIDGNVDTINTATAGLAGAAMRGTDSAALASVVGALTDAAAAGDPTTADTVMQYVKQLINVLIGTAGIGTWPAEAAPGNAVSLAEALRAVATDVSTTIPGTITTLQSDTDDIQTRLPASLVGGAMDCDVSAIQAGAITAAAIASNAITSAELATSAVTEIQNGLATSAEIAALNDISTAEVNTEVDTALSDIGLDHLVSASVTGTDVADNSIIAQLVSKSATADWDSYDNTSESLEGLRDRGDSAWITGGGGGITDILNVQPLIPAGGIDLANTATWQLGLMLINSLDDLPSTAEITPGTISIDRKAIGGTSWSSVVSDAACSEAAGLIYYDEVFDSGTGYAEGDSLRVTFKSQKITVSANDYEISDATGRLFYSTIRESMRGTDSAATAANLATVDTNVDAILVDTGTTLDGKLDTIDLTADAILVDTGTTIPGTITTLQSTATAIEADTQDLQTQVGTAGAGLTDLGGMSAGMKAEINTEADTALSDIALDHLIAVAVTDPDVADNSIVASLASKSGTATWPDFQNQTDSLQATRDQLSTVASSIGALNDISTAEVATELATYDGPTNTEMTSAFTEIKGATWSSLTDTIEHIRNKQTDIETDTAQIGAAGAGLTDLGGMSTGMKAEVNAEADTAISDAALATAANLAAAKTVVDAILVDTDTTIPGLIAALNDLSAAAVNAEVVDVIRTDTLTLPAQGAPTVTPTLSEAVSYLFKAWRNKSTQTATTYTLFADDGTTTDHTATVSDDGTTATKGEVGTGA